MKPLRLMFLIDLDVTMGSEMAKDMSIKIDCMIGIRSFVPEIDTGKFGRY